MQYGAHLSVGFVLYTEVWILHKTSTNKSGKKNTPEAFRVLKPGGFYLFYGIADTKTLLPSNGPDPFSQLPAFTEKHYTEQELRQAYSSFTIISLQLLASSDKMHGENVQNQLWSMIAQKPA